MLFLRTTSGNKMWKFSCSAVLDVTVREVNPLTKNLLCTCSLYGRSAFRRIFCDYKVKLNCYCYPKITSFSKWMWRPCLILEGTVSSIRWFPLSVCLHFSQFPWGRGFSFPWPINRGQRATPEDRLTTVLPSVLPQVLIGRSNEKLLYHKSWSQK